MLRIALDLWNGSGNVRLERVLVGLDPENQRMLATFLLSYAKSPLAIDVWLALEPWLGTGSR